MINKLPYIPHFGLDLNPISVYDIDYYSTQEVISIIVKRLNQLLNEFNKIDLDGIIEWIKAELPDMVRDEVLKQLEELINNGALKEEIYKRIEEYINEGLMEEYITNIINDILSELDITQEVLAELKKYFKTDEFKSIIRDIVSDMDITGGGTEYPVESYEIESQVLDKKYPPLNVKRYGAKGDGISNDLQAFKNGLETAVRANGNLHIPADTYYVKGKIYLELDDDKVISFGMTGDNAIIKTEQNLDSDKFFIELKTIGNNTDNSLFTIFNLHNIRFVNVNKKNNNYTVLYTYRLNVDIENLTVDGYYGFLLTNNENTYNNFDKTSTRLEDLIAVNITGELIKVKHELNSHFNNIKLYGDLKATALSKYSVITMENVDNTTINNITVIGKEKATAFTTYREDGIIIKRCSSITITNISEYIPQFKRTLTIENSINIRVKNVSQYIQHTTAVKVINNIDYTTCRNIEVEGIYIRSEESAYFDIDIIDNQDILNNDMSNITFKSICTITATYDSNLNEITARVRHPYTKHLNSHYSMSKDNFTVRVCASERQGEKDLITKSVDGYDVSNAIGHFQLTDNEGYVKIELPLIFEDFTTIMTSVKPCIFGHMVGALENPPYEPVFDYNSASFYLRDLDTNNLVTKDTFDETKANFIITVNSYL